eukprot:1153332-Pelagomonas_calceolata.AAC.2
MQAAPAIHCLLAPLGQSVAGHTPEVPSSSRQGRGCRSCSTSHQQISCKLWCSHHSARRAHHTIARTYIDDPITIEIIYIMDMLAYRLEWSGAGLKSPDRAPQAPGPAGWLRPRTPCKSF